MSSRLRRRTSRAHGCVRSEEHTSELQSRQYLVCRLLLEKKKNNPKVEPRVDQLFEPMHGGEHPQGRLLILLKDDLITRHELMSLAQIVYRRVTVVLRDDA